MSLKRSLKLFALANVGAFAISLPASGQGVVDTPFADDPAPQAVAENIELADASRQIPAKNSLYVPNPAEPIRVQLTKFNGTSASELVGTALAIASPDGSVKRYKVNEDGAVIFNVEKSGLYAFITSGPMGHAAFPVVIRLDEFEGREAKTDSVVVATPTITLPIFSLGRGEASRAVSSFLPPTSWQLSDVDASLVSTGDVTATIDFRVNLSENGRMEGQVVTLMRGGLVKQSLEGNNLLLYKDGELVARAISDSLGRFAFEELTPGAYGIICAGPGGYAAFAFEAVMPALSASLKTGETLVSTRLLQGPVPGPFATGDVLPIVPIPSPAVPEFATLLRSSEELDELPLEGDAAFAPVPGGGGAGFGGPGGGFGGGGGGGMGGAGGLLGLAGLGIAAAAAASDSNDRVIVNPTPDPSTPFNVLP